MVLQFLLHGIKWRFGDGMDGRVAGIALPAANRGVDIDGVDFHRVANASNTFRRDYCRATAREPVQDDIAAGRTVQNCVGHQGNRLDGWVKLKEVSFIALTAETAEAWIGPDVRPISTKLAKLHIVAVSSGAILEYKDQQCLTL